MKQQLVITYLIRIKERFPNKIAIVDGDHVLTFGQLWQHSVELATMISPRLSAKDVPVVIDIPRSAAAIVAMAAVQLAGAIYVPFDGDTPRQRRRSMLNTLSAYQMLTYADAHYQLDGWSLGGVEDKCADLDAMMVNLGQRSAQDPVYIIFTSGSTGAPKGVTIANASVIDYIDWATTIFSVSEQERIANQAPFFFDNSVLDIYLMMATGASLYLPSAAHFLFPNTLVAYMRQHAITMVFMVPSLLTHICALRLLDAKPLPDLKKILFAGEAMPVQTLNYFRKAQPEALLANLYGPTETTVDVSFHIFDAWNEDCSEIPIGSACPDTELLLLDEDGGVICQQDQVGELAVAGVRVGLGYWNQPALTDASFIAHPRAPEQRIYKTGDLAYRSSSDGLYYLKGRKDNQIKHMGYRIEAGEVEAALMAIAGVQQACLCYDQQNSQLVAFYTSVDGLPCDFSPLSDYLPPYMRPRRLEHRAALPMLANGKVDRRQLQRDAEGTHESTTH
ncbi:MAG: amino acid adenylation domain-containing protein [Mariprofundales bacterium]